MPRPSRTPATYRIEGLPIIFVNAAGMDIGAECAVERRKSWRYTLTM